MIKLLGSWAHATSEYVYGCFPCPELLSHNGHNHCLTFTGDFGGHTCPLSHRQHHIQTLVLQKDTLEQITKYTWSYPLSRECKERHMLSLSDRYSETRESQWKENKVGNVEILEEKSTKDLLDNGYGKNGASRMIQRICFFWWGEILVPFFRRTQETWELKVSLPYKK